MRSRILKTKTSGQMKFGSIKAKASIFPFYRFDILSFGSLRVPGPEMASSLVTWGVEQVLGPKITS